MIERDYNYAEAYRKMISAKEKHREIEVIVADLQQELRLIKEESLLVCALSLNWIIKRRHHFISDFNLQCDKHSI